MESTLVNNQAHILVSKQSVVLSVDLQDIKELVQNGCQLFQVLSFDPPLDFYSWLEGDGYDFSREFSYTKDFTEQFVKYSMLSSRYIQFITCEFDMEYAEPDVIEAISKIINDINSEKKEYKRKQDELSTIEN